MAELNITDVLEEIIALIIEKNKGGLSNILADLHPVDISEILKRMSKDDREYTFDVLTAETASEVLSELDEPLQEKLLKDETAERIVEILENLDSDDAADIVGDLPEEKRRQVLAEASDDLEEDLRELLVHDDETAGGLMALELIALNSNQSVIEAIQEIRREKDHVEDIYVIYVVDDFRKLVGYVTLKQLVLSNPDVLLRDIMEEDVPSATTGQDQEEVVALAKKYDLVSVPVVDNNHHLVGRITIDDIMDVMEDEASEDYHRMAGLPDDPLLEVSAWLSSLSRMPWLVVGFVGELVSAFILFSFQVSLQKFVALSFFIPIIMALGGNSGTQCSSIVVRGLATGDLNLGDTMKRVGKEMLTGLINGTIFGIALGVIISFWLNDTALGITVGVVLNFIIVQATIFGTIVPFTLKRFGFDPAIASGPFISTTNDVLGLAVYLTVVSFVL